MQDSGGLAAVSAGISETVFWTVVVLVAAVAAWKIWKIFWAAQ